MRSRTEPTKRLYSQTMGQVDRDRQEKDPFMAGLKESKKESKKGQLWVLLTCVLGLFLGACLRVHLNASVCTSDKKMTVHGR